MTFLTDQQTLDDLEIFGRHGADSVFAIFNRTMTRQGSAVLEDMLRHPLSEEQAIRQRSAIFQSFRARETAFPFRGECFDIAEAYLSITDERTRLSGDTQTLGSRMASLIAEGTTDYKNVYKGVTALMEILQQLHSALWLWRETTPDAYREEKEMIESLLAEEELQPLLEEDAGSKLPYTRIAVYDTALRFRHRGTARRLLQYVYRLDALIWPSAGSRRSGNLFFPVDCCRLPTEQRVRLVGVYHPQSQKCHRKHGGDHGGVVACDFPPPERIWLAKVLDMQKPGHLLIPCPCRVSRCRQDIWNFRCWTASIPLSTCLITPRGWARVIFMPRCCG